MRKRGLLQAQHCFTACHCRFVYIPEKDQDWSFGGYNTAKVMEKLTNRPGTAFGLSQFMFKGTPEPCTQLPAAGRTLRHMLAAPFAQCWLPLR